MKTTQEVNDNASGVREMTIFTMRKRSMVGRIIYCLKAYYIVYRGNYEYSVIYSAWLALRYTMLWVRV